MLRAVWWTSGDAFKEFGIGVEEMWIAESDGKAIVAVSDVAETLGQTFAYGW